MLKFLRDKLEKAEGRSEFVIAVFCDIRGFSAFSTSHESPDTAMFIKRFYSKLLTDYFPKAVFGKPTGDGLLLVFQYSEQTLSDVSNLVINSCLKAMVDFPTMFANDPMVNFLTPPNLGFGIGRGTACCLFSGKTVLDYSGQLLNLASRLNDLARPKGIVIDESYKLEIIPEDLRNRFSMEEVYIRGIAEESPRKVLFLKPEVSIPDRALFPLHNRKWKRIDKRMSLDRLRHILSMYAVRLPEEPLSKTDIKAIVRFEHPKVPGMLVMRNVEIKNVLDDSDGYTAILDVTQLKDNPFFTEMDNDSEVTLRVEYRPKAPKPKQKCKPKQQ